MMQGLRRMMDDIPQRTRNPTGPRTTRNAKPYKPPSAAYIHGDSQALAAVKRRAANLVRVREATRRTAHDVATAAGIQRPTYYSLERGESPLSLRKIDTLAAVFSLTPAALLAELDREATT